jgi:adenylate cyclase class 2
MPVEIEIKLKVPDLVPVREKLKQLGAAPAGEVDETNVFFDTPERMLLGTDCALRLRRNRNRADGHEKLVLTYKGPRAEGPVKRREEIEVQVDSFQHTVDLLARLGYERQLIFEKRRESWHLDQCLVELDTLPQLGNYVEFECLTEAEVLHRQEQLGLSHLTPIPVSYPDLVSRHLHDRRSREKLLTF